MDALKTYLLGQLTGYTVLLNLMRQIVAILLNEREQTKKRVADQLERLLASRDITSSRVNTGPQVERRIKEMSPAILVLDYLLGDHGTGLDVLQQLQTLPVEQRPVCFFLTDEPSISVAVEAMRLGARNYFEIEQPQVVQSLVREIESFNSGSTLRIPAPAPFAPLSELVAADRKTQSLFAKAEALVAQDAPLIIVDGPTGSGRTAIAQALVAPRSTPATVRIIDYRFYIDTIERIVPSAFLTRGRQLLECGMDLIIEHVDEAAELLDFLVTHSKQLVPHCRIVATTKSPEIAKAWVSALAAERLTLLPLSERPDDIPALAQRFSREASQMQKSKAKPILAADLKELLQLPWPGNVRELKSVIYTASWLPQFSSSFIEAVRQAKEPAHEAASSETIDLSPEAAIVALAASNANERVAAAMLGCSVRTLRTLASHRQGGSV